MIKYLYCSKKEVKTGEGGYTLPKKNELLWLLVDKPSFKEIKKIVKDFSIDEVIIKKYSKANYSKRVSLKPFGFVFVDYFLVDGKVAKLKSLFILDSNLVIIFCQDQIYYREYFDRISDDIKKDKSKGRVSYILFSLLEEGVEENYDILKEIEKDVVKIEEQLTMQNVISSRELVLLKRNLFEMNKTFWASLKLLFNLKNGLIPITLGRRDQLIIEDIYHTTQHQIDIIFSQKEILTDLLQINVSHISNLLSKVMKTLTALTVIVAVPNLIAGIYQYLRLENNSS
ncbi:hypothetical protein HZA75_04715 [Candidatus Roizmanbacteria bacterium]|nr:hypothetical protein [Candidatus Roizmanbacteria bacterium]